MRGEPGARNDFACRLESLNDTSDALAHADAHGGQSVARVTAVHLCDRGSGDECAAHAERVPECDRAAVRIYMFGIVRQSQIAQYRKRLRGEGLV